VLRKAEDSDDVSEDSETEVKQEIKVKTEENKVSVDDKVEKEMKKE
jgi:hypothetical protein